MLAIQLFKLICLDRFSLPFDSAHARSLLSKRASRLIFSLSFFLKPQKRRVVSEVSCCFFCRGCRGAVVLRYYDAGYQITRLRDAREMLDSLYTMACCLPAADIVQASHRAALKAVTSPRRRALRPIYSSTEGRFDFSRYERYVTSGFFL